jgi:hypothetical protein
METPALSDFQDVEKNKPKLPTTSSKILNKESCSFTEARVNT